MVNNQPTQANFTSQVLTWHGNRAEQSLWSVHQGLTLVNFSAQPEPFPTQNTP